MALSGGPGGEKALPEAEAPEKENAYSVGRSADVHRGLFNHGRMRTYGSKRPLLFYGIFPLVRSISSSRSFFVSVRSVFYSFEESVILFLGESFGLFGGLVSLASGCLIGSFFPSV